MTILIAIITLNTDLTYKAKSQLCLTKALSVMHGLLPIRCNFKRVNGKILVISFTLMNTLI